MSNSFNHSNLGEQFKKAVTEGLATGDFHELNILVNDTVTDAISEASRQVKNASASAQRSTSKIYEEARQYEEQQRKRNEHYKKTYQSSGQLKHGFKDAKTTLPAAKTKNIGQISSILYTVFGSIGLGITFPFVLAALFSASRGALWQDILLGFLLLLCGGSATMLQIGVSQKKRLERMKRYLSLFAGKMYVNISDLADSFGKSTKYVLKDVKKMLKLCFFPEGHLDKKETCLMLDDATYREYLRLEKERKAYELEHNRVSSQVTPTPGSSTQPDTASSHSLNAKTTVSSELQTMISEGQAYIQKLHELNDKIPGEVISAKLDRMENLLKEIFKRLVFQLVDLCLLSPAVSA